MLASADVLADVHILAQQTLKLLKLEAVWFEQMLFTDYVLIPLSSKLTNE